MMMLRSSSSSTPKASKPLSSRTNDSTVHPIQTKKSTKKPSSIPRLSFRRLSKTSRQRREDGEGRRRPTQSDRSEAEKRQSHVDLEDDGDVQYIDLDNVVMASPGTDDATFGASVEEDGEASIAPCFDERERLERCLDEGLVMDSPGSLCLPRSERSVAASKDNDPTLLTDRPVTPPRSREGGTSMSPAASSPPRLSPSPTAAYRLLDSLRKRRRGSGQRILWRNNNEDRSPSPPLDGTESNDEWAHVQSLGWEEQLAAFWSLLYPNQVGSVLPLKAAAQGPPLRSCMKRQRRGSHDEISEENVAAPKILQWGSNSAVEFNLQTPAFDLFHLSPATVELRFPATLDGYEELHPVDEEMMQLTKENSAILAALEDFDDSSSDSSIGINNEDETHCFEDTDDDEVYQPPVRRQSSARNSRRASGIFTPAPFLESTSPDPVPPSSRGVMPPFDKLSLTSPIKGHGQDNVSSDEQVFAALPPASFAVRGRNKVPTIGEQLPRIPLVLSIEEEVRERKSAEHANQECLPVLTWQQKLSQVCLSPVSGAMDMATVPPLEKICSKLTNLIGDERQFFGGVASSSTFGGFEWLKPFDTCASLRSIVKRGFLLARGALSLLPPVNYATCSDDDIESLAQSEWLDIEIKVLEALVFQLSTGLMQDVSTMCDSQAQQTLRIGKVSRIRVMAVQEERELMPKEIELRKLERCFEGLKQIHTTRKERAAVVRVRYSTYMLQAVSPFALMDTDGIVSHLAFPTPVQGLDVEAIHTMDEPLVIDIENSQRSSTANNGMDTRFDPSHPCSKFYASLLKVCLQSLGTFCQASGMGSLLALEVLLGRLEDAFWDVHQLYSKVTNTTIDAYVDDGTRLVRVSASVDSETTFCAVYNCSDVRTLYTCRPTFVQLDGWGGLQVHPISRRYLYPQESLIALMKELVRVGSMKDCKTL